VLVVAGLADQGVKEVTLLGQNVNASSGTMGGIGGNCRLRHAAVRLRVREIPGIERISLTTSHPNDHPAPDRTPTRRCSKLVNHLHFCRCSTALTVS
jgi:tRNA-2-methylthio-N6-dimethylallyladenosine synthase